MSEAPKDWRAIAVRVITTAALPVTAVCAVNIYATLKAMRSAPGRSGGSEVEIDPSLVIQPFEMPTGAIEVCKREGVL